MDSPFKNVRVPSTGGNIDVNYGTLSIGGIVVALLPYVFGAAGIILVLNIIFSGYQMMTSQGDPKVFQAAQSKLTNSLIGILIMFTAFFVVPLIINFLGINLILFK